MNINRHKVFISYCHKDDQFYKNELINMKFYNFQTKTYDSIFDDYSVRDGDIDDTNMSSEQIRVKIRDEYIKDATVLILLCGKNTKNRKHIDWEIHAAMYNSPKNPKMGIVVINLPGINDTVRASNKEEMQLLSNGNNWINLSSREEYHEYYPFMPERIIDNFVKDKSITVVNWNTVYCNSTILMKLIDNAFKRRKEIVYDNSRTLRRKNS